MSPYGQRESAVSCTRACLKCEALLCNKRKATPSHKYCSQCHLPETRKQIVEVTYYYLMEAEIAHPPGANIQVIGPLEDTYLPMGEVESCELVPWVFLTTPFHIPPFDVDGILENIFGDEQWLGDYDPREEVDRDGLTAVLETWRMKQRLTAVSTDYSRIAPVYASRDLLLMIQDGSISVDDLFEEMENEHGT